MARQLRIEFPGALYHVTSRGNERHAIYRDEADYRLFLETLGLTTARFNWLCHAYCLMGNHYHLLLETPEGNLSKGMRHVNGVYSQKFNHRHRRSGHLMQGRYKAMLVEKESYLLEVARYIVLNPVRANMVDTAGEYCWSSYRATAGLERGEDFLTVDWILNQFSSAKSQARHAYKKFVSEAPGYPSAGIDWSVNSNFLAGSPGFVESCLKGQDRKAPEIPKNQRFADRPTLEQLFHNVDTNDRNRRNALIACACGKYGYAMVDVARFLGLHYSTVSKALSRR